MTSNISVFFFSETRLVEIMDNLCSESEVCIVITLLNLPPVVILFQFPTIHPCYFLTLILILCLIMDALNVAFSTAILSLAKATNLS